MSRIEHTLGERFGRLVIASVNTRQSAKNPKKIEWLCRCDCGNTRYVPATHLHRGQVRSCGCLSLEVKKARKGKPLKYKRVVGDTPGRLRAYRSWEHMKARCLDPKSIQYEDYGARGITVCSRWRDNFDNFFADLGERPLGLSIGRVDNDGNYEPGNCRWETVDQQASKQ